jgi:AAA+ ATPase superfamily predicted ATPase
MTQDDVVKNYLDLKSKQVVVPEKPEDYEITVPEGMEKDEVLMGHFQTWAHKAGLSKDQAKMISDGWNEFIAQVVKDDQEAQAKAQDDAVNELKDIWKGDSYEKNTEAANMALGKLALATGYKEDEIKAIAEKYKNDTRLIRMFHTLSTKISEDVFEGGIPGAKDKEMSTEQFLKGVFNQKGE